MKKKKVAILGVLYIAVIALLISIILLFRHLNEYHEADQEYKRLRKYTIEQEDSEPDVEEDSTGERVIDWAALKAQNPDLIGWIYIPGTNMDYPVVQGEDNDFYLKHTFSRQKNSSGTIFVDANIEEPVNAQNMIVYGHNMRDGSMFAGLKKFMQADYLEQHSTAWFYTEEADYEYRLFAAYTVYFDSDVYTYQFGSSDSFQEYLSKIRNQAAAYRNIEVSDDSKLITLSTCHGSSGTKTRCIVQGIRIK